MQKFAIGIVVLLLIGIGAYVYYRQSHTPLAQNPADTTATSTNSAITTPPVVVNKDMETIGNSVNGNPIVAYHFGSGNKEIVFIGGLHGGYEWNTALVANQLVDYLKANPTAVPANEKVTVIPVANPDGLSKVVGTTSRFSAADVNPAQDIQVAGRFNANNVDLNRNFDCDWQASGVWQSKKVSGGTAAFSEPESQAIQKYMTAANPAAVVVWYSSAGGVYASNCHEGVLPETTTISGIYAKASGYPAHESFDFYATTGDMVNWLAKQKIPAFSVLLKNHQDTDWDKNQAGIVALLQHYAQ